MPKLTDILKTDNIIKISPQDTLSSTFAKLGSSHDGAFVFDDNNKYLGMINPYYCLIKSSYPGNAKAERCLFHAPRLKLNMPISKVAQLFVESKIHYLPVFNDQEKFSGIISARHLLTQMQNSNLFRIKISEVLKNKKRPLVTIYEDDSISQAVNIFKSTRVSKIIVIGHDMKLKGILSYYDLVYYLVEPKKGSHRGDREGNRVNFNHMKVKNFAKTYVLTLTENNQLFDALNLILTKNIGSVVIIDQNRHPIGIITTKDLLTSLIQNRHEKKIEVTTKNLSPESRQIFGGFFNRFNFFVKKQPNVSKAKLMVQEEKKGGLFKVGLALFPKKGQPEVIKKEGKSLPGILDPIISIIKNIKK